MSKFSQTISGDGDVYICDGRKIAHNMYWLATALCFGSFGGGTVTLKVSPDGGTTKIALPNQAGNATSFTADSAQNVVLGNSGNHDERLSLYASMSGSTSPDVTFQIWDNT